MLEAILFSATAFLSTLVGGLFAVKHKKHLHLIMGFAAGVLLGVVAFDILPEIISMVNVGGFNAIEPMAALVIGFLLFHILEKVIVIHHSHEDDYADHKHPQVGIFSALALAGHSFMDGVGIGLGFQVNPGLGLLVALAVISHGFTDGLNTVTLMLTNKNSDKKSKLFLLLSATAPVLGTLSSFLFNVTPHFLLLYLGFFAGSLLYIGASDILPEAHSKNSSLKLIGLTILGAGLIYIVSQVA